MPWQRQEGLHMYRRLAFFITAFAILLNSPIAGAQWAFNGTPAATATNDQVDPQIASDGSGGAIVVWGDSRAGNSDIYAQRFDAHGNALWIPDGIHIRSAISFDL